MKKRYYDFLTMLFIGILLVFSVIRASLVSMRVPVKSWQLFLFAAGALILYCLIYTKPGRAVFLCALGAGFCYVIILILRNGFSNLSGTFAPVIELAGVIIRVGTGYYDESVPYLQLMTAIGVYSLVVAFPVYSFMVRRFRFYPLFTPALIFFMAVWGINRYVDKLSFYIFITVAVVCYIRHVYLKNRKNSRSSTETPNDAGMLVYFIPVAILVILFSAAIPVKQGPIEWPWLDEKIYDLWWDMHRKFSIDRYDTFSLAKTGFGDSSRLGGPVYPDNTPVLFVKAPTRVYLRGAVYDTYTGAGWTVSEKNSEYILEDRIYDHTELAYGWKAASVMRLGVYSAEGFDEYLLGRETRYTSYRGRRITVYDYINFFSPDARSEILAKLFPKGKISVQHLNVRTKSLFTPLKLLSPITGLPSEVYQVNENAEGIFLSSRRLRGESTYNIDYLQPAYGMREIENYFSLSKPFLYETFNERLNNALEQYGEDKREQLEEVLNIYERLERRTEEIYRVYTAIPEGVPERVAQLARDITYDKANTYERVKSLETYLRSNYQYTLTPAYPPSDQDFVDYFLFDGKEGYCSYFASALCIMTRSLGIPARYVEGFLLPEKSGTDDGYQVTNQNAHAWVEVYLEGIGWVSFEPTPPMAYAQNYFVRLYETGTGESSPVPDMYEEYMQRNTARNTYVPGMDYRPSDTRKFTGKTFIILLISFVLAVILANLAAVSARRIILPMLPAKKSIPMLYRYAVSLLSQAGCGVQHGQTAREYAETVDGRYAFTVMRMSELAELYYSVRFGSGDADRTTLKRILSFISEIKKKTGEDMYFASKVLYRYLLFRG